MTNPEDHKPTDSGDQTTPENPKPKEADPKPTPDPEPENTKVEVKKCMT
jgi:hypothetical protein